MPEPTITRLGLHGTPMPDPAAVVNYGNARFTMLTPRLIRIQWATDDQHDDRPSYAFPSRYAKAPPFRYEKAGQELMIDTGALRIFYRGGRFEPASLEIHLIVAGASICWRPGTPDIHNLRGARRTLDGCRGAAALEPGIISRDGWVLVDDSASVRFDPQSGWVQPPAPGEQQDWYFFGYGHNYLAAIADYAQFGGRVPMIPRWALGAWWSRYHAYTEPELRALVEDFTSHQIPLDTVVIDMDWHLPGWTGYTWNRDLFPDPPGFLAWLHQQGLRVTLNLHPADGVHPHEAAYPAVAAACGHDPATAQPIPFRISDPTFVRAYFEHLHHPLEDEGVDFWWLDWQQGRTCELPGLDPLPWLNHLHTRDMQRREGRRPITFSRWGWLGNHRYPIGFSGDTFATWEALRFQPYFTATAANVLYGWWSHDIGAHFDACEPELYARWVQVGALSPILRLHSTKSSWAERRPWAFPSAILAAARTAFQTRYTLLPYLYTLARIHTDRGLAPCRPCYYSWPEEPAAYIAREQYMLGDQILVAPIVHPSDPVSGLAPADVWVPPGVWIERNSGETFHGPAWVRLEAELDTIPQLVPAGAIIPLAPPALRSHQQPADTLTFSIFPGHAGATRIYADAGEGEAYRDGAYEWTPVSMRMAHNGCQMQIEIGPGEGTCPDLPRIRRDHLHLEYVLPADTILVDGVVWNDWVYDALDERIICSLPPRPREQGVMVQVEFGQPASLLGERRNQHIRRDHAQRLIGASSLDSEQIFYVAEPGRSRAIARLGGPWARLYQHTTPEDAVHSLGSLVIAAAGDGSPVHGVVTWRMIGPDGVREEVVALEPSGEDRILSCPFTWNGTTHSLCWSLELQLQWGAHELRHQIQAQPLFPTIGHWQICVRPSTQPLTLAEALKRSNDLDWQTVQHNPEQAEFQSLTEHFRIPFTEVARTYPTDSTLNGYARTWLSIREAQRIRIAYHAPHPPQIYLNGTEIAIEHHIPAARYRVNPDWSRSIPVEIPAGTSSLIIISQHPADEDPWFWFMNVMIADEHDQPIPHVTWEQPHQS
ncbi:TIM-barrel domain-containing protein [Candidatus Oscillochloris fontis]|uniref:glycoside hydrolase family 31 protein n=1 Tax=Candidatus Oscillochloris fontis TaxID=2496868 RepID=UPI00101C031D|nr:glycoside hydrolase family 31 protein [Candidatus Oscillochloris fontis]